MSSVKKKVIISACLLGELCRYDGKTKEVNAVIEAYTEYEIIPFCPEAPLFGTPRERINVVEVNGENRIITNETNIDVTVRLEREIYDFCEQHPKVDAIVLKSKSPSCGYKNTPILNVNKEVIKLGDGIASQVFQKYYKNIKIQDEFSLNKK
ncbi:DUF523 domain-containing protein [Sulfurimonas sp. SAG-AH-194-C20]|nr:DUF523 domain-containing protein [Sulfurimonas sp. SAG-AH-194-C20]MDF1878817.1 DUF523 domain-containing protein [Sulfurimonas sp. SAG-AH-194-C20]